jgi:hypothetical protein
MKKFLTIIFSLSLLIFFTPIVNAGLDDAFGSLSISEKVGNQAGYKTVGTSVPYMISNIISLVLSFLGILFMGLIIYSGIKWMTAGGQETKVEEAKKLIKQAIIGLIIVLSAYALSYFIINSLSGLAS